jgi:hypothetical protein
LTEPAPRESIGVLMGDASAVQHHGEDSPQAIQSVAGHLLILHGVVARDVSPSNRLWVLGRALRQRGIFHKLKPPSLGSALNIRHLLPGGGVNASKTRAEYVVSVYQAWVRIHFSTVDTWYNRYVLADELDPAARGR